MAEVIIADPEKKTITTHPTYLYDEVLMECLSYFDGDELAATTWINKYAMTDNDGHYVDNSPDAMHQRMAKEFARIESNMATSQNLELGQPSSPNMDSSAILWPKMISTISFEISNM